jgi:hypothetical protein
MNSQSLFRGLVAAGLSLAVTACGPQEELSSADMHPAGGSVSAAPLAAQPPVSPEEARAAATAAGGVTDEDVVLGITYVRPHGVRPAIVAYEVPVTSNGSDGMPVRELVYVDASDASVVLRVPLANDLP